MIGFSQYGHTEPRTHWFCLAFSAEGFLLQGSHECWAQDAMDAAHQLTSDVARGRRSRVVLAPLGWCQVC